MGKNSREAARAAVEDLDRRLGDFLENVESRLGRDFQLIRDLLEGLRKTQVTQSDHGTEITSLQEWVGRLSEQVAHLTRLPDQIYLDEARGAKVDALGHELSELEAKHHRELRKLDERVRFLEAAAGAPRQVTGTFTVDI
jgi:polyhydroxyalkanoate synthesis regulator phasin